MPERWPGPNRSRRGSDAVFAPLARSGPRASATARALVALALAAAGSGAEGCVRYVARPIAPERTAAALEARRLSDPALTAFLRAGDSSRAAPPAAWTLPSLTVAALYFNPDLAVARADLGLARSEVIAAGARPNPTLDADVAAITHGGTKSPSVLSAVLGVPFLTAGRRGIRIAEAEAASRAQRLRVEGAAWAVRAAVRDAALAWWSASEGVGLSLQATGGESALVTMLQRRLAAGESSALDVGREAIALNRARAALRGDEMRLSAARVQLAAAVGVPVEALDSARLDLDAFGGSLPAPPSDVAAHASALLERSDIRAALADYAASEAALRLEVARQYPNLTLSPGLHWEAELKGLTIAPSIVLPILNRNRGPIAVAAAGRDAAAARFTRLQATALAAVDQALAEYAASLRALASADSAALGQRALAERTETLFRAGEVDRVALVSAQVAAVATGQEQLAARTQAWTALSALESATQRPLVGAGWTVPAAALDTLPEAAIR